MKISQEDAARLMFAHAAAVDAAIEWQDPRDGEEVALRRKHLAAEKAFAELVAQLTDGEGL
jgi:hypothetical protein